MSQKTTNSLQFDPTAKSAYDTGIKNASGVLNQFAANPYNNSFFNMNKSMLNNQALQMGQRNMSTLTSNAQMSGFGNGQSGFLQSGLARNARATSGLQAGGLFNAMSMANENQQRALGQLMSFQPLMTGSTQTTGGLGSWLPQLIGAGLGAAAGVATGGMSTLAGGMGSMIGGMGNSSGFSGGLLGAANPFHGMGGMPGGFGSLTPTPSAFSGVWH